MLTPPLPVPTMPTYAPLRPAVHLLVAGAISVISPFTALAWPFALLVGMALGSARGGVRGERDSLGARSRAPIIVGWPARDAVLRGGLRGLIAIAVVASHRSRNAPPPKRPRRTGRGTDSPVPGSRWSWVFVFPLLGFDVDIRIGSDDPRSPPSSPVVSSGDDRASPSTLRWPRPRLNGAAEARPPRRPRRAGPRAHRLFHVLDAPRSATRFDALFREWSRRDALPVFVKPDSPPSEWRCPTGAVFCEVATPPDACLSKRVQPRRAARLRRPRTPWAWLRRSRTAMASPTSRAQDHGSPSRSSSSGAASRSARHAATARRRVVTGT